MVVLYNDASDKYAVCNIDTGGVVFTEDLQKATEITSQQADKFLKRCSSKLKGFKKVSLEKKQQPETVPEKTKRVLFSEKKRIDVYSKNKGCCSICGEFVRPDEFTIDHIVPLSKGGSNDISNLQCCCRRCNELKANMQKDDFFRTMRKVFFHQAQLAASSRAEKAFKALRSRINASCRED